jgi:RNA polymerase sigma-70 factor (ECF subfamily)
VTVKKPSLEERQAIARLKQGNLDALEVLVRIYQVRAVYTALLIVRDQKLAEDIVQDTFVRSAEKINQFDESRHFGAWFLRSVINASIKAARRQKRFISWNETQEKATSKIAEWLVDPDPSPELLIETEETRQIVWKALGDLTPEQRAVVIMRHFLDMSETEMTQELDRPLTTIRWRLKTARNQLRKILQFFWHAEYAEYHEAQDEREG